MKQVRILIFLLIISLAAITVGCNKKTYICPAYQSVFFLDQKKAAKYFTAKTGPDSLPLDENIKRKDQYLLAIYYSKKVKEKKYSTVEKKTEFFPMERSDSLRTGLIVDSTALNEVIQRQLLIKELFRKEAEAEQKLMDSDVTDTIQIDNDNFIDRNKKKTEEKDVSPSKEVPFVPEQTPDNGKVIQPNNPENIPPAQLPVIMEQPKKVIRVKPPVNRKPKQAKP